MAVSPIAYIASGPLSDKIVEPLMSVSNSTNSTAQFFINFVGGFGPGRGIAIVFMFSGLCIIVFSLLIYLNPRVRNIDSELPDEIYDDDELEVEEAQEKSEN